MTRCAILECMYNVIKDSLEWGIESRNNSYGYFVDGVIAVTEELLKEVDKPTLAEALKEYSNSSYDIADRV